MAAGTVLQLFAKAPVAGAVKTRLIPPLDAAGAVALHRRLTERAAAAVAAACAAIPDARSELWCSPGADDPWLRALANRHGLVPRVQPASDLGARMRSALAAAMPGRALLLGSDCPDLDAAYLIAARDVLERADAVFAPADDGGYALVGCRGRVPDCFGGIAWSTAAVMAQTRTRLRAGAVRWIELPPVRDVDRPADLERLAADPRYADLLAGLYPSATTRSGADPVPTTQPRR